MARLNKPVPPAHTHGGGIAARLSPLEQLRRSVLACMLWERDFYEDGESIADRIRRLVNECDPDDVAALAVQARSSMHLRHVPLLLVRELARHKRAVGKSLVADTLAEVIQRPDELSEFVAIYWAEKRQPLSAQVKKGLARAFCKFTPYQLAKYNRDHAIKLRDVLFLCHAKAPEGMQITWKRLVDGTLPPPDTWEVALSGGAQKRETWERLLAEGKLGYLALLRNLRGMESAGVPRPLVREAILARRGGAERVLPFRFVAAAKAAPALEDAIDQAMLAGLAQAPKLPGKTVVIVDVSGSMYHAAVSAKSDLTRAYAACALAAILREVCEEPVIYATAGSDGLRKHQTALVPARRGMALVEAIHGMCRPLGGGGIFLKQVMDFVGDRETGVDRVVVITDEQDCARNADESPNKARLFGRSHYLLNVGTAANGIGTDRWNRITGFSESVVSYIVAMETGTPQSPANSNDPEVVAA